jgi:hypothetical protein
MRAKPIALVILPIIAIAVLAASAVAAKPAKDCVAVEPPATPWEAVAASGEVRARYLDTVWRAVARGDELTPRTTVETGRKGRLTLTRHASLLILDPESRVELPASVVGDLETSVVQTRGSVLYKVDGRSHPHFEVVTPYLVAGVKGTSFLVTVNDRYTAVTVRHGRVEVSDPLTGARMTLGPGESVLQQHDERDMDPVGERRASRNARKEAKRLRRIEQREAERETAGVQPRVDPSDTDDRATPALAEENDPKASWGADADARNDLSAVEEDVLRDELDSMSKQLIEEMIREEIRKGAITEPVNDDASGSTTDPGTTQPD